MRLRASALGLCLATLPSVAVAPDPEGAGWDDPNIVIDAITGKWAQIPEPGPDDPLPPPPFDEKWKSSTSTVVVLIAAFRETRCPQTLINFFSKAKYPDRVFMGIIQQNGATDIDCLEGYCAKMETPLVKNGPGDYSQNPDKPCKYFDNVRMVRMSDREAKGPVFARAKQVEVVNGATDDFCMQIDAHTDVVQDWDTVLLSEWGACKNEYAVMSTYPTNAGTGDMGKNTNNHWEMPFLCGASFESRGFVRNAQVTTRAMARVSIRARHPSHSSLAQLLLTGFSPPACTGSTPPAPAPSAHIRQASAAANLKHPAISPLWAAGLSFNRCHAELNVPNDPELKSVFSGEEYGRGARLWTNGCV
jgi:hypothetical protein